MEPIVMVEMGLWDGGMDQWRKLVVVLWIGQD